MKIFQLRKDCTIFYEQDLLVEIGPSSTEGCIDVEALDIPKSKCKATGSVTLRKEHVIEAQPGYYFTKRSCERKGYPTIEKGDVVMVPSAKLSSFSSLATHFRYWDVKLPDGSDGRCDPVNLVPIEDQTLAKVAKEIKRWSSIESARELRWRQERDREQQQRSMETITKMARKQEQDILEESLRQRRIDYERGRVPQGHDDGDKPPRYDWIPGGMANVRQGHGDSENPPRYTVWGGSATK